MSVHEVNFDKEKKEFVFPNKHKRQIWQLESAERALIMDALIAGQQIQNYSAGRWINCPALNVIDMYGVYRIGPKELQIPWDVIKKKFKYAAMDYDGSVFVCTNELHEVDQDGYWVRTGTWTHICALEVDTTGVLWSESAIARPEESAYNG